MSCCNLFTPFELASSRSWQEHPRPQLKREHWLSLCGEWTLSLGSVDGEAALGSITVPYPPESRISGVERTLEANEFWIYRHTFLLNDLSCRVLLHFGAVDQIARVWVNGKSAGEHTGGYLPFTLEITDLVRDGENLLTVETPVERLKESIRQVDETRDLILGMLRQLQSRLEEVRHRQVTMQKELNRLIVATEL